jgi:secondary thiamine-phosphate synthase enzyme
MRIARLELEVQTHHGSEAIDITERVQEALERSGLREGVAVISALHTTCALAVNEPEEGLLSDILRFFSEIAPSERKYEHNKIDNNAHAHLRSLLLSPSLAVPFYSGKLELGTWQRVLLLEWDGPRRRRVTVSLVGA